MAEQTVPIAGDPRFPWEPPLAGTELEHLLGMLNRLRFTFRWKASGLDSAGLNKALPPSTLTLGGLLKHLAAVETLNFTWEAFRSDPGEPWRSANWGSGADWVFTSAASDSPEQLYGLYDDAVVANRARIAEAIDTKGIDQLTEATDGAGNHVSLRRFVCDLIEEYGRHTGHADLLRENVDGLVGEDPPEGWLPPTPG